MSERRARTRANGEGSVYETANGRWKAQVVIGWSGTKPRYKRKTHDTKAAARAWIDEVHAALDQGLAAPDDRITVGQWLDRWLELLPDSLAEGTRDAYGIRVRLWIKPKLGSVRLRQLTPGRVALWLKELADDGLKPSTQQAAYSTLRRAMTMAQQEGLVSRNAVAIADGPKGSRSDDARWTTPEDVAALITACRTPTTGPGRPLQAERLVVAVNLLAGTAVRLGELLALRWSDLNLTTTPATVTINRHLVRSKAGLAMKALTKTKRARTIPVPVFAVEALLEHRRRQAAERLAAGPLWQDHDLVITTEVGTPVEPRTLSRALERLAKRANIAHVHPHAFRHGAISTLLAEGVPLEIASEVAGHSSIRVTKDVYGHVATEHLNVAATALDRALGSTAG